MKPKILVVEDGLDSWQLLNSVLGAHQYEPISAARKHQPHAILLDLGLPCGDGFVVLDRLKKNHLLSAIPVIIVTGQDPLEIGPKARKLGAAAFIQKPVKADDLIATIRGVLETKT